MECNFYLISAFLLSYIQYANCVWRMPGNCAEVKKDNPQARDGEYFLNVNHKSDSYWLSIYCHNMAGVPAEYITLPAGDEVNFSKNSQGSFAAEVFFSKLAVDVSTLQVLADDLTFARIENLAGQSVPGTDPSPQWGKGMQCDSCSSSSFAGYLQIDLTGTPFHLPLDTTFITWGYNPCMEMFTRSESYQEVFARCGGYCGGCYPAGTSMANPRIQLDINPALSPTTCKHVNATQVVAGMLDQVSKISDGDVNTCATVKPVSKLVSRFTPAPSYLILVHVIDALHCSVNNLSVIHMNRQCSDKDIMVYNSPYNISNMDLTHPYFLLCKLQAVEEIISGKYRCDFLCPSGYNFVIYLSNSNTLDICEVF